MRVIMTVLIFLAVLGLLSAITGIQSVHNDPVTGTVITYHHGLSRVWALGYAAICASACYAIYRKMMIAWWAGWIVFVVSAIDMLSISLPSRLSYSRSFEWYSAAGA